jgi:hypothetical protein
LGVKPAIGCGVHAVLSTKLSSCCPEFECYASLQLGQCRWKVLGLGRAGGGICGPRECVQEDGSVKGCIMHKHTTLCICSRCAYVVFMP